MFLCVQLKSSSMGYLFLIWNTLEIQNSMWCLYMNNIQYMCWNSFREVLILFCSPTCVYIYAHTYLIMRTLTRKSEKLLTVNVCRYGQCEHFATLRIYSWKRFSYHVGIKHIIRAASCFFQKYLLLKIKFRFAKLIYSQVSLTFSPYL